MNRVITALIVTASLTTATAAGTLRPEWVDADAQWIVHLDLEALHDSRLGHFIMEHAEQFDIDMNDIEEMKAVLGFDLRSDLLGMTAYGTTSDSDEDGVIVALTTDKAEEAIERLMEIEEVDARVIEVDDRRVYAFTDENGRHFLHVRPADRRGRQIVAVSDDRYSLARALRVLDGDREGISMEKSELIASSPKEGSIVYVAATDIDALDDFEPASQITRFSDSIIVDMGEHDGRLFVRGTISADSDENAANIAQIVQGILALGRLVASNEPDMAPLREVVNAVSIRSEGRRITLRFQYDTEPIMHLLQAMAEQEEEDDHDEDEWDDDDRHERDHDDND